MKKSILILLISFEALLLTGCSTDKDNSNTLSNEPMEVKEVLKCPDSTSPWDIEWLPRNSSDTSAQIDIILADSGLSNQGKTILEYSRQYGISPAFALAMFNKEATFASIKTRAYRNNNPGNIIATGNCNNLPANSSCNGNYGEISTDGRFGIYASMNEGIEAYFKLLSREYKPGTKRNCNDFRCIISAYCPPSECDVNKYVSQIEEWTIQYQCNILGVSKPLILSGHSSLPEINSSIGLSTLAPTPTEDKIEEYCLLEFLTPEEKANCGNHTYLYEGYAEDPCFYKDEKDNHKYTEFSDRYLHLNTKFNQTGIITENLDKLDLINTKDTGCINKKINVNTYETTCSSDSFSINIKFNLNGFINHGVFNGKICFHEKATIID